MGRGGFYIDRAAVSGNVHPTPLEEPLMQLCRAIFKAGNRCRSPDSRARFPIYMISPVAFWSPAGAGGGICLVWTGNLNSSANTMTDGKIPVGTCDQQTGCDLFSLRGRQQTYCVCGTAATNISFENFLRAGSISREVGEVLPVRFLLWERRVFL